jgi:hypothetical protein
MPFTVWPIVAYGMNRAPGTWPARYVESLRSTTSTTTERSARFLASQPVLTRSEVSGLRAAVAPITAHSAMKPATTILRETNGNRPPIEIRSALVHGQPSTVRAR